MRNPLDVRRDRGQRNFLDLVSAFDDMFNRSWALSAPNYSRMLTDIQETDQAYVLSIDMPGVTKDDIQIQMDGNILTVSAGHREEKNAQESAQQEGTYSRQFRQYQQSFTLPMTVSSDQIEAHYENGVLELYLPKSPEAQPKKIEIQSGKGGFINRLMGGKQSQQQSKAEAQQKTAAKH